MGRTLMGDAFAHHVWATLRLVDTCRSLTPEQLATAVPGTYGSILETVRHLVASDCGYLYALTGGRRPLIDQDRADLVVLRSEMEANATAWSSLLAQDLDADLVVVRRRDDGSETRAPIGIRLAQALHHGNDHRSQVCTTLTTLGVEPPTIDAWEFAEHDGRLVEIPATS